MLACKTFIGKRLELQHYRNVVMDRTIEIVDESDLAYNLSDSPVIFELFAKPHGKSLESFEVGVSQNDIVFDGQTLNYRAGIYFHECYQMTDASPSEKIMLFYGVSEII